MGLSDIRDQFFFYFVNIQDLVSLMSSLYAVYFQLIQSLGKLQALHIIYISCKGPLYVYKIKKKLVLNVTQSHGLYFVYGRHGCECKLPTYHIRKGIKKARENYFALTAHNLWNTLPRCIQVGAVAILKSES